MERLHRPGMVYSEQEIIALHALFLTTGIHYLKIPSVEHGRMLIDTLVTPLSYYCAPACITTHRDTLSDTIYDCAIDLAGQPYIEAFFAEHFFSDFLWIELTESLMVTSWYKKTEKYIYSSPMSCTLPIVFFYYETSTS